MQIVQISLYPFTSLLCNPEQRAKENFNVIIHNDDKMAKKWKTFSKVRRLFRPLKLCLLSLQL